MKLILYADIKEKRGDKLETLIKEKAAGIQTVRVSSITELSQTLCRPLHRITIAVVFLFSQKQIKELVQLKPVFDNIRIILVLSPRGNIPMAATLDLKPSFISFPDTENDDFDDILSVLRTIQSRTKEQPYQHRT